MTIASSFPFSLLINWSMNFESYQDFVKLDVGWYVENEITLGNWSIIIYFWNKLLWLVLGCLGWD
jgi:hypothetical protein